MRKFSIGFPRPGRFFPPAGLTAVLLVVAGGCGGKHTPVSVSGVVTLDGNPVEAATVYFYAVGDEREGRPAFGTTDKDGKFQLSTLGNNDGALRHKYKVVITRYVSTQPNLKIPDFPDDQEGRERKSDFMYQNFEAKGIQPFTNVLPTIYADSSTTPLECNVTGRMTVKFELKSQ